MDISYYKQYEPIFGVWHITRLIGEGSFGKVFEMEREDFGQVYKAALKAITIPASQSEVRSVRSEGMDEESVRATFHSKVQELVKEFALMSKLKGNSNVVSYENHQVIEHKDNIGWDILIQMELLTPLDEYIQKKKSLPRQEIIKLGIDLCKALELCQKHNIIHRDIKPENTFISENGDFKLGDFGVARTIEKTTGGLSKQGSYPYMAPEIYNGKPYGTTVDIYSLGLILYRLLNGNRLPFLPAAPAPITYADRENAMAKRFNGAPLPIPSHADGRLGEIVLKACAFEPKDRYSSPGQMRQELEAILYNKEEGKYIYPDGDEIRQDSIHSVKTEDQPPIRQEGTVSDFGGTISDFGGTASDFGGTVSDFGGTVSDFGSIAERTSEENRAVGELEQDLPYFSAQCISGKMAGTVAVQEASLKIYRGESVTVTGSNAAMELFYRMISGLEPTVSGRWLLNGRDITHLPVPERHVGVVSSAAGGFGLVPKMTGEFTLQFALQMRKKRDFSMRNEIGADVHWLLAQMGLLDCRTFKVKELSNEQKVRLAIARSLAGNPELLLMDDPFVSLRREEAARVWRDLQRCLASQMEDFHFTGAVLIFAQEPSRYSELADREISIARFCRCDGMQKAAAADTSSRSDRKPASAARETAETPSIRQSKTIPELLQKSLPLFQNRVPTVQWALRPDGKLEELLRKKLVLKANGGPDVFQWQTILAVVRLNDSLDPAHNILFLEKGLITGLKFELMSAERPWRVLHTPTYLPYSEIQAVEYAGPKKSGFREKPGYFQIDIEGGRYRQYGQRWYDLECLKELLYALRDLSADA